MKREAKRSPEALEDLYRQGRWYVEQVQVSVQGPPVPRPPGPRSFWACIYDACTTGDRVALGTFTTQRF